MGIVSLGVLNKLHARSSSDIPRCIRMNAKQRRRMSRRPKPIPGVETRSARNRRYRRRLDRSFNIAAIFLGCALLALGALIATFAEPDHYHSYQDDRGSWVEVVVYALLILMRLCGMSLHAMRVMLICISVVGLVAASVAWRIFTRIEAHKPGKHSQGQ